jgi:enamine deaminase RidA (YjgF/YER057c/UK114 family)
MERTATQEDASMTITRHQILAPPKGYTGPMGPIISQAVTHGGIVYLCGVVTPQVWRDPSNTTFSDVRGQTREVLERIDELLADAGTDKSKILTAQVWLSDIRDFYAHNEEWNAWVDPENPPARACIEARLVLPQLLVEVMVTAAR